MNNWCICWFFMYPLNAELNPICHLLATIFVVSRLRVKCPLKKTQPSCPGSRDLNWTGKGLTKWASQSIMADIPNNYINLALKWKPHIWLRSDMFPQTEISVCYIGQS